MSLAELLVAVALVSLLVAVIVWIVIPSLHYTAKSTARSNLDTTALTVFSRLEGELQMTAPDAMNILNSTGPSQPTLLWFTPILDVTGEGTTVWDTKIILYSWTPDRARLTREEYPPGPPAVALGTNLAYPLEVSLSDVMAMLSQQNGTERILATQVKQFTISSGATMSRPTSPLKVVLELETDYQGMIISIKTERSIHMKNGNFQ